MLSNAYMDDTCRSIVIFFFYSSVSSLKIYKMQVRPLGLINVRKKDGPHGIIKICFGNMNLVFGSYWDFGNICFEFSLECRVETPQNSYQCSGSRLFFSGQESRVILPVQRLRNFSYRAEAPKYFYQCRDSGVFLSAQSVQSVSISA